jgi:hypothetical protein
MLARRITSRRNKLAPVRSSRPLRPVDMPALSKTEPDHEVSGLAHIRLKSLNVCDIPDIPFACRYCAV